MLVEHFIVGSSPIISVMIYQIKILNTSNNTRILLISSPSTAGEIYSTVPGDTFKGATPSKGPESGNFSVFRRHKMLFQLSSGQLGFKGATRKSSFVISKLIQLFFNRINILFPNFRYIPCNIYFLGPRNNYSVLMDQIRLGIRSWPQVGNNFSISSSALGGIKKDNSFSQSSTFVPEVQAELLNHIFNLPSLPRPSGGAVNFNAAETDRVRGNNSLIPATLDGLPSFTSVIPDSSAVGSGRRISPTFNNSLGGIKIFDITPIPFNGCKLKKSRRK